MPSGGWEREGPGFAPVCEESEACTAKADGYYTKPWLKGGPGTCKCSGNSNTGGLLLPNLEIVDRVMIPKGLKPGRYVLGWRCATAVSLACS